jgi:hypothetical protein
MARFCRDREVVLSFWKRAALDSSCPWILRVYCVNELAKAAKVATEFPPIPGSGSGVKPKTEFSPVVSKEAPTEVDAAAVGALADVKQFLKQLGGADGDPQT